MEGSSRSRVENVIEADTAEGAVATEEAETAERTVEPRTSCTSSKCGGPTKGHLGLCGQKYSVATSTFEREGHPSRSGDISLTLL